MTPPLPGSLTPPNGPRYRLLAEEIERQISAGALQRGDRLTSLRRRARDRGLSVGTVLEAYLLLERRGLLEARPRSGFYVRGPGADPRYDKLPEAAAPPAASRPLSLALEALSGDVVSRAQLSDLVPLGIAKLHRSLLPTAALNRCARRALRTYPEHGSDYDNPQVSRRLRRQIARRLALGGASVAPEELLITNGATEALSLALRALARRGDEVVVETPTYYGLLEILAALGLRVVEVPCCPQRGPEIAALRRALARPAVRALVLMPNGHNPLGYVLEEGIKGEIVALAEERGVAIIEDDVYGELCQRPSRPRTLSSFDRHGSVLLCSSFSKLIGPGYRLGFLAPGRFGARVAALKGLTSVSNAVLPQAIVAEYLESGQFDRFVVTVNRRVEAQLDQLRQAVVAAFPAGLRVSRPAGGCVLWLQLPAGVSGLELYRAALEEGIGILPGDIYSPSGRFGEYVRISGGNPWSDEIAAAVETLGRLCRHLRA
ncbi:MAG: PLP-dependent aminotransferase family protein [Acidobacteriota bacterium]